MAIAQLLRENRGIKGLTLCGNSKITHKTAVFIADALESHAEDYPMLHLEFAGIDLGTLGLRRLCELFCKNGQTKLAILGRVGDAELRVLGEFVERFVGLQTLQFEEKSDDRWSKAAMDLFVAGFRKSESLLDVKVGLADEKNKSFANELRFYGEANRKKAELKEHLDKDDDVQLVEKQFSSIM